MVHFDAKKLNVRSNHIVEFPQGLVGYATAKRYILLDEPASSRFMWLTSVDRPELSFLVSRPENLVSHYRPALKSDQLNLIGASRADETELFLIVTIPSNALEATCNLRGPVVINPKSRMGAQLVLDEPAFSVQFPILKSRDAVKVG